MLPQITYRITGLKVGKIDFQFREPVIFRPVNVRWALVLPGNGWPNLDATIPHGDVKRIDYTITVTDALTCRSENFRHQVERWCSIGTKHGLTTLIASPLFKAESLAFLLTGKKVNGIPGQAVQFVC